MCVGYVCAASAAVTTVSSCVDADCWLASKPCGIGVR